MSQSNQPMTRYGLTQALFEETFRGANYLLHASVKEIAEENAKVIKEPATSFFYHGVLYGIPTYRTRSPQLHSSLWAKFVALRQEYSLDSVEAKLIAHFFVSTTNKTMSHHDLVKVFPAGLHQILEQFKDVLVETQVQPDAWLDIHVKQNASIRAVIEQKLCFNLLII